MNQQRPEFSIIFLIASIIGSIVFFIIGEIFLVPLLNTISSIVLVGIYFGVFGIVLFLVLNIAGAIEKVDVEASMKLIGIGCIVGLFILGMLFEFLYELGGSIQEIPANNVVFLLDDSGSMEDSDPNFERINAVEQIVESKGEDFNYAIYRFGEEINCVRPMASKSAGMPDLRQPPMGQTPVRGALSTLQQDIENGAIGVATNLQVVMLTDGHATDLGWWNRHLGSAIKYYQRQGIPINTVGLGQADQNLMEKISSETGGVSVMASDVSQLVNAMNSAVRTSTIKRTLLTKRPTVNLNILYGILHILFIALLGCVFAPLKLSTAGDTDNEISILAVSGILSLVAGIIMEIGMNIFAVNVVRFIVILLIGITFAFVIRRITIIPGGLGGMQTGGY